MKWTSKQDQWLMLHAHEGIEACRKGMAREFGVARSAEAIERHGLRIGLSFARWAVCPRCGAKVRKLTVRGICEGCNWEALAEEKRAARELLSMRHESQRRKYDAEQKALRRYVLSMNMSANMSEDLVS